MTETFRDTELPESFLERMRYEADQETELAHEDRQRLVKMAETYRRLLEAVEPPEGTDGA